MRLELAKVLTPQTEWFLWDRMAIPTARTEFHGAAVELRKHNAPVTEPKVVRGQLMKMSDSPVTKAFSAELNGVTAELRNAKTSVKQLKIVRDMLMTALQQPSASTS